MAVLKQIADICVPSLTDLLNNAINYCHWPLELGSAIITQAHKKSSTTAKENYRPIMSQSIPTGYIPAGQPQGLA